MYGIIFAWILFSVAVGIMAERYGRNRAGWMLLALLISPLIAVIFLLAGGKVETSDGKIRITERSDYWNRR